MLLILFLLSICWSASSSFGAEAVVKTEVAWTGHGGSIFLKPNVETTIDARVFSTKECIKFFQESSEKTIAEPTTIECFFEQNTYKRYENSIALENTDIKEAFIALENTDIKEAFLAIRPQKHYVRFEMPKRTGPLGIPLYWTMKFGNFEKQTDLSKKTVTFLNPTNLLEKSTIEIRKGAILKLQTQCHTPPCWPLIIFELCSIGAGIAAASYGMLTLARLIAAQRAQ